MGMAGKMKNRLKVKQMRKESEFSVASIGRTEEKLNRIDPQRDILNKDKRAAFVMLDAIRKAFN